jgi:hypothetical protein
LVTRPWAAAGCGDDRDDSDDSDERGRVGGFFEKVSGGYAIYDVDDP